MIFLLFSDGVGFFNRKRLTDLSWTEEKWRFEEETRHVTAAYRTVDCKQSGRFSVYIFDFYTIIRWLRLRYLFRVTWSLYTLRIKIHRLSIKGKSKANFKQILIFKNNKKTNKLSFVYLNKTDFFL